MESVRLIKRCSRNWAGSVSSTQEQELASENRVQIGKGISGPQPTLRISVATMEFGEAKMDISGLIIQTKRDLIT